MKITQHFKTSGILKSSIKRKFCNYKYLYYISGKQPNHHKDLEKQEQTKQSP